MVHYDFDYQIVYDSLSKQKEKLRASIGTTEQALFWVNHAKEAVERAPSYYLDYCKARIQRKIDYFIHNERWKRSLEDLNRDPKKEIDRFVLFCKERSESLNELLVCLRATLDKLEKY